MPDVSTVARYGYQPRSRRYHDRQTGRFISAKQVRAAVDTVIDTETVKIREIAQKLVDGSINLAEWQIQTASLLKGLHVSMGLAANGGLAQTSPSDLGFIGSRLKAQYEYLRDFALQISKGEQPLNGSLVARAALYSQAARETYSDVVARSAMNGGAQEELSQLAAADHCEDCVGEAAKGWSPIGSLIPIGDRRCMSNCRCSMAYR